MISIVSCGYISGYAEGGYNSFGGATSYANSKLQSYGGYGHGDLSGYGSYGGHHEGYVIISPIDLMQKRINYVFLLGLP